MGKAKIYITRTIRYTVEIDGVDTSSEVYDADCNIDDATPFSDTLSTDIIALDGLGYGFCWDYLPGQEEKGEHKRLLILEPRGMYTMIGTESWEIFLQAIIDQGIQIVDKWNGPGCSSGSVRYVGKYITEKQVANIQEAIKDLQPETSDASAIVYWQEKYDQTNP